jgi:DNA-binding CsgD family transcriptional regulator
MRYRRAGPTPVWLSPTSPTRRRFGRSGGGCELDLLVNAAGVAHFGQFAELDRDRSERHVRVNIPAVANALYCRGVLDHDAPRLLAVADRYDDASRPLLRAKALEAAAGEFVENDDRDQARAAFTGAVEVYTALGAAADAARLQATFRAHGIRRGPRAKHRQARNGWDSLTPTEIKIAAFVEDGLSNPEIAARLLLSRRTIGTHVSHILKKLDVHSRTDIARESALRSVASR